MKQLLPSSFSGFQPQRQMWQKNEITNKSRNESKSSCTLDLRAFAHHFAEIFSTCNKLTTTSHEKVVFIDTNYLCATDLSEVSRCFLFLKNKKTLHQNDLPMFLFFCIIILTIQIFINQMTYILKQAIVPVRKRGDINNPANNRQSIQDF